MNAICCVKRAMVIGYCMGVRKAVDAALHARSAYPDTPVYSYGPLIHNPETMRILAEKGVKILNTDAPLQPQLTEKAVVIIRAHGIAPNKRQELADCGAIIIDATCPRVLASQCRAKSWAEKGAAVILAGDKNHGEIIGITGCVQAVRGSRCIVLHTPEEAEAADCRGEQVVLIAQTTIKRDEYQAVAAVLRKKNPALQVLETICPATEERQQAVIQLCQEVDAVLIVGGDTSANTRRLLQTALDEHKPAWLVENAVDIPPAVFEYASVGIAAGASTPDSSIEAVERALLR